MRCVILLPDGEVHAFGERPTLGFIHNAEALIRRGEEAGQIAVFRHRAPDGVGVADGIRADALVELVGEQRVELDAEQPPLGEQRAVLLDDGKKVRDEPQLRNDDRLAEQRTAFCAANVEDIAQRGKVAERHVVLGTRERVGKACAVDVERQALFAAECADGRKLLFRVERAVLRRLGEVDHAGHDRVVAVRVVLILLEQRADLRCGDLAVLLRQREDLVAAKLDGAGLVHADVPCVRGDHALVRTEQRVDDGRVRLCAADEKVDLRVRRAAGGANFFARGRAVFVRAVTRCLRKIRFAQALQNGGMRALEIVTGKRNTMFHEKDLVSKTGLTVSDCYCRIEEIMTQTAI